MRVITRSGDEGQNYREETRGDLPHSIQLDTNARGEAQISVKLYFEDLSLASATATDLYLQVARHLTLKGVKVAGFPATQEAR